MLLNEIRLVLPNAAPEYRKKLAIALFYKFILSRAPKKLLKPTIVSGGAIHVRPLSPGMQTFETYKEKWPLTEPIMKYEALIQCSGEAQYVNDIPHHNGQLWAAFIPTSKTHAKIGKIDAENVLVS